MDRNKLFEWGRTMLKASVVLCLLIVSFSIHVRASDDDSLRDRLLNSTVRIRSVRNYGDMVVTGHGTAFAVDMSKWGYMGPQYLLSAAHNALGQDNHPYPTLLVETKLSSAPTWSRCHVVTFDRELDLCLLKSDFPVPQQSVLASKVTEVGQSVMLVGSPRGIPLALYEGILTQSSVRGSLRSSACLPFDHGCSGGPFFNTKGEVIGVAVAGVPAATASRDGDMDKGIGLFVPLPELIEFLENKRAGGKQAGRMAERSKMSSSSAHPEVKPKLDGKAAAANGGG
jgi:S1-C subfamily serine protease